MNITDQIDYEDVEATEDSSNFVSKTTWNSTFNLNVTIVCDEFLAKDSVLTSTWFQTSIYVLYSTIFFVGLTGNGIVCYVVYSNSRMKTVTNYFIVNLAVGDILMALFCVPTSFISTLILQYWPFGSALCPSVNFAQAVSVLISTYTLVAISIDRYIAIMWPLRPRMSKTQAKLLILGVWAFAMIVSLPIAIVSRLFQPTKRYELCDQYVCQEYWPSKEDRYHYTMMLLVLQYLVPLLVLVFSYSSIAVIVWGKRPPGEAENTRDQRMARSKRKMIKMMMTVVIVFTICWLPFNILMLAMDNDERLGNWSGLPFLWTALHWLSMSHSCYNPVIYCWMNARFRAGFITTLGHLPCFTNIIQSQGQSNHNTSIAGIPLTGLEGTGNSGLRRINTCTTYVSVRRKTNGDHCVPIRSASFRSNDSFRSSVQPQRHLKMFLESHSEEQI